MHIKTKTLLLAVTMATTLAGCAASKPTYDLGGRTEEELQKDFEDCTIRANQVVTAQGEKGNIFLNMMIINEKEEVVARCMKRLGY